MYCILISICHEGFRTYNSRRFEILKEHVDDLDRIISLSVFVSHGLHTKVDMLGLLGIESDFDEEVASGHHHSHYDHSDEKIEFGGGNRID